MNIFDWIIVGLLIVGGLFVLFTWFMAKAMSDRPSDD